jgi:flagellar protein FliL
MAKAEEAEDEAPKAKGGNKLVLILIIVIIVLLLAAVGIGAMFLLKKPAGDAGHAAATTEQTVEGHGEGDHKADGGEGKHGAAITVPLGQPITVNLAASNDAKLLQVELDLTTYDHEVGEIVKANRAEIINNIMLVLSDVNSTKLRTREGKEDLQKQIKDAVNAVIEKRSGKKDAIDDVYFTKLLMQ